MTGNPIYRSHQGFTLIELVAAMVLVGVAAALAGAGFMSLTRIGEGKNYVVDAQLAQQRMELILAQKRTTSDFSDLDPCDGLSGKEFCDDVSVSFIAYDESDDVKSDINDSDVLYCVVHVEVGDVSQKQDFFMRLYHYE